VGATGSGVLGCGAGSLGVEEVAAASRAAASNLRR